MDIPRDKLLTLAQAYVAQATPLVREQERLIDQLRGEAVDSPLVQRVLKVLATASRAIGQQEALIQELKQWGNGE